MFEVYFVGYRFGREEEPEEVFESFEEAVEYADEQMEYIENHEEYYVIHDVEKDRWY